MRLGDGDEPVAVQSQRKTSSQKYIEKMTTEDGKVTADCQFCGAHYVLEPHEVGRDAVAQDG